MDPAAASTNPERRLRVLIVEDHLMFAQALRLLLEAESDLELVGTVSTGEAAVELTAGSAVDVVLMDIDLPGIDGVVATRRIREQTPDTQVVVITAFQDADTVAKAVQAGACGFLPKTRTADEVAGVIRRAAAGEMVMPAGSMDAVLHSLEESQRTRTQAERMLAQLSNREVLILQAIAEGRSTGEIASQLFISRFTVQTHIRNILAKLDVHSKLEAVLLALRHGLIRVDEAPS
jgi:DNA-binding NarL/FixJ family response regulator